MSFRLEQEQARGRETLKKYETILAALCLVMTAGPSLHEGIAHVV